MVHNSNMILNVVIQIKSEVHCLIAQSAGAVEYTDFTSAEE